MQHVDTQKENARQDDQFEAEDKLTFKFFIRPFLFQGINQEKDGEEDAGLSGKNVRCGLISIVESYDQSQPEQPLGFTTFEVAQKEPKHDHAPKDDEDFIAGVTAVKEDVGRDKHQKAGNNCAEPTQVALPC